jgi:hypothetical protein
MLLHWHSGGDEVICVHEWHVAFESPSLVVSHVLFQIREVPAAYHRMRNVHYIMCELWAGVSARKSTDSAPDPASQSRLWRESCRDPLTRSLLLVTHTSGKLGFLFPAQIGVAFCFAVLSWCAQVNLAAASPFPQGFASFHRPTEVEVVFCRHLSYWYAFSSHSIVDDMCWIVIACMSSLFAAV